MTNRLRLTKLEWFYLLMAIGLMVFLLIGCTQAQVDRAQAGVDQAKEILAKAEAAEARVAQAVATAREIAEVVGNDRAKELVAKADAALALAHEGTIAAKAVVSTADAGLATAKASMAAGSSWLDILGVGLTTFLPPAGVAFMAIRKASATGLALKQTIAGVQGVRESLGENDWKTKAAPALAEAQDEAVKALIAKIQAVSK